MLATILGLEVLTTIMSFNRTHTKPTVNVHSAERLASLYRLVHYCTYIGIGTDRSDPYFTVNGAMIWYPSVRESTLVYCYYFINTHHFCALILLSIYVRKATCWWRSYLTCNHTQIWDKERVSIDCGDMRATRVKWMSVELCICFGMFCYVWSRMIRMIHTTKRASMYMTLQVWWRPYLIYSYCFVCVCYKAIFPCECTVMFIL